MGFHQGGAYSGPGVAANTFYPPALPVGTYTLLYTYTDSSSGCTNGVTDEIVVEQQTLSFNLPVSEVCLSDSNFALSGEIPLAARIAVPVCPMIFLTQLLLESARIK